jgi:hypothetical protein
MPAPTNERQALERERGELTEQLISHLPGYARSHASRAHGTAGEPHVADPAGAEADGGDLAGN